MKRCYHCHHCTKSKDRACEMAGYLPVRMMSEKFVNACKDYKEDVETELFYDGITGKFIERKVIE